jgi:hypothetical protein
MAIVQALFKIKKCVLKVFSTIIYISLNLLCFYVSLTVANLMGIDQSTEWTISYMTSFISSFFMIDPIINFFKINLIKKL